MFYNSDEREWRANVEIWLWKFLAHIQTHFQHTIYKMFNRSAQNYSSLSFFLFSFVFFLYTNLAKIFYSNRPISSDGIRFWHWECKSRLNICICCLPLATWIQADITHARDSFLLLSLSSSSFFSLPFAYFSIFLSLGVCVCVFCSFHFFSSFMLSILLIIHLQPFNKIVRLMCNIYNVISLHKDLVLQGKISWTYLQNIFKLIVDTKCLDMYISCIWYIRKRKEKETVCVCNWLCLWLWRKIWLTHPFILQI